MKLQSILVTAIAVLLFSTANAQKGPATADEIMQEAMQQASKEKKNVLIIFHASWCGWCHRMDSSMNDASVKKYFDNNFVTRHLTVLESPAYKAMENPGVMDLMKKYKGENQGIPFWLIFDTKGNLLADSQARPEGAGLDTKGSNVGCPASASEVAHFIKVLKATTKLSPVEQAAIEKRFRQNEH